LEVRSGDWFSINPQQTMGKTLEAGRRTPTPSKVEASSLTWF